MEVHFPADDTKLDAQLVLNVCNDVWSLSPWLLVWGNMPPDPRWQSRREVCFSVRGISISVQMLVFVAMQIRSWSKVPVSTVFLNLHLVASHWGSCPAHCRDGPWNWVVISKPVSLVKHHQSCCNDDLHLLSGSTPTLMSEEERSFWLPSQQGGWRSPSPPWLLMRFPWAFWI